MRAGFGQASATSLARIRIETRAVDMLSDGKTRPNEKADVSGAAGKAQDAASGQKDARASQPAAGGKSAAAASDEALAKEALEGLKQIRAKARMDKMAIPKPQTAPVRPAVIVAKPPPPRPTWAAPLATLGVAVALVMCACTGVIAYLTMQP